MEKSGIMIGWSRGEISPLRKTFVSGQFHSRITDEVLSPLMATALALESKISDEEEEQAVFLSCDLGGVASPGFKSEVIEELDGRCPGLDCSKLTMNATHTHTAPCLENGWYEEPEDDPDFMKPDEYRGWLVKRLADIVAEAWEARRPGGISRGFGYAVIGRCRRAVYSDGSARMYGDTSRADFVGLESCDDHRVNILFTHDEDGGLTGMILNVACPSQCEESKSVFSADFWHNVRESVKARYGESVHVLPQCAPAGDLSPHLMEDHKEECDLRGRLGLDDKGIIARRIMAAVVEGLETASPIEKNVVFIHKVKRYQLPKLMVTEEQYELEKRIHHMSEEELSLQPFGFNRVWPFGLVCDLISRYERQKNEPIFEMDTHVIRIGDMVFATNPFELFVDYGRRIRNRSKALQTCLVQLSSSSENGFYLPTKRAFDGGHYSGLVKSNWVGPDGGDVLVDKTIKDINSLFKDEDYPRTR